MSQAVLDPVASTLRRVLASARSGGAAAAARVDRARASVPEPVREGLAVVQPRGWAVLTIAVVSWIGAYALGWAELVVVALAATVLLLAAVAFVVGRTDMDVDITLARRRVVAGRRAVGRVEVTNRTARAQLATEVELAVGTASARFGLPRLAAGAHHEEIFTVPTRRRGVIPVGPVRSVRGDALGLLQRDKEWTEHIDLMVHPRTVALHGTATGFLKDLEGRPTRDLSPSDVSFHALREYAPGDDRRHVHWKTTARTGTLMVRQFEETRRSHLVVVLPTSATEYDDPEEFELAISVAGSLGVQALREDRDVTVVIPGGQLRGRSGPLLLDELARLELRPRATPLADLVRQVGEHVPDASAAVLLHGMTVPSALVHLASTRLPVDVRALAVRVSPGAPAARTTAGGLAALEVGALEDLPGALRRADA